MSRHGRSTTALTHWFRWRHVTCKVIERPNYMGDCDTLLELHVIAARHVPVPVTSTGFLAHFMTTAALKNAGGPAAFFKDWMDREAASKTYQAALYRWRQGDLFDHAGIEDKTP